MLSDPLKFVICCGQIKLGTTGLESLYPLLAAGPDWQGIIDAGVHQGLNHLVYRILACHFPARVPKAVLEEMKKAYYENSLRNLRLSSSLIQILDLFREHDIPAIGFKGPVQSEMIYGDPGIRGILDIDILVRCKDAVSARDLLVDKGFSIDVEIPDSQIPYYLKRENFFQLINHSNGIVIDLHWEMTGRYGQVPFYMSDNKNEFAESSLAGRAVATLSVEAMLLHLCIHSASHCYDKLESIYSIAGILASGRIKDWHKVFSRAEQLRCTKMLWVGIELASHFFKIDPDLIPDSCPMAGIQQPLTYIIDKLTEQEQAYTEQLNWRFSPFHFKVRDTITDQVVYFLRLFFQPTVREWMTYKLPDHFLFLYHFTRPYRLLKAALWR